MTTLILTPNDTFRYTVTVIDSVGTPYPLTGATVWFTARKRIGAVDPAAYCYWVDGGAAVGITVADPDTGECVVELTPAQTALFVQAAYRWDFQIKTTDDKIRTVDRGVLVVRPTVNDRTTAP